MKLRAMDSRKRRSQVSEKQAATLFKGKVQPASGALPIARFKGDVISAYFLVDDKTTNANSFSVNVDTWNKLRKEAFVLQRNPAMRVNFTDGPEVVVVAAEMFRLMLEAYTECKITPV